MVWSIAAYAWPFWQQISSKKNVTLHLKWPDTHLTWDWAHDLWELWRPHEIQPKVLHFLIEQGLLNGISAQHIKYFLCGCDLWWDGYYIYWSKLVHTRKYGSSLVNTIVSILIIHHHNNPGCLQALLCHHGEYDKRYVKDGVINFGCHPLTTPIKSISLSFEQKFGG